MRAVTSASSIQRRALCPGSARLEAQFAEPPDSEYSEEGSRLHESYMRNPADDLTPEQMSVVTRATADTEDFIQVFMASVGIGLDSRYVEHHESEYVFYGSDGLPMFPGHSDYVRVWPDHKAAVISDAKFGYMEVESAAGNLQTASYAAMLWQLMKPEHIGVCIVSPRNFGPRRSSAIYQGSQMPAVCAELERIVRECDKEDAPLNPSLEACRFCRGKSQCSAFRSTFSSLAVTTKQAIQTCDNEQLVKLLDACKLATQVAPEVKAEARIRIEDGRLTSHRLQSTGDTRKCLDSVELYHALARAIGTDKLTPRAFESCLDISWGKLEDLVQELTGLPEKKAKELVKNVSEPYVKTEPKEKRIVAVKP